MENDNSSNLLLLEFCKERLRFFCDDPGEEDERYKVGEGHESVEDVCTCPDGAYREVRSDENREDVQPAVNENGLCVLAAHQVLQAFFGVVRPTEDGGESEEYERCGEEVRGNRGAAGDNRKAAGERFHRDVDAFESELRIPRSSYI